MSNKNETKQDAHPFTKGQFIRSRRFKPVEKDVLAALLDDGAAYTMDEVRRKQDQFMQTEVR